MRFCAPHKCKPHLYEKEFGLGHQSLAVVTAEHSGQRLELHAAVRPVEDPLVAVTQQHAHKGGGATVVLLGYWEEGGQDGACSVRVHKP